MYLSHLVLALPLLFSVSTLALEGQGSHPSAKSKLSKRVVAGGGGGGGGPDSEELSIKGSKLPSNSESFEKDTKRQKPPTRAQVKLPQDDPRLRYFEPARRPIPKIETPEYLRGMKAKDWEKYFAEHPEQLPNPGINFEECMANWKEWMAAIGLQADLHRLPFYRKMCRRAHPGTETEADKSKRRHRTARVPHANEASSHKPIGKTGADANEIPWNERSRMANPSAQNRPFGVRRMKLAKDLRGTPKLLAYFEHHPTQSPSRGESYEQCLDHMITWMNEVGMTDKREQRAAKKICRHWHPETELKQDQQARQERVDQYRRTRFINERRRAGWSREDAEWAWDALEGNKGKGGKPLQLTEAPKAFGAFLRSGAEAFKSYFVGTDRSEAGQPVWTPAFKTLRPNGR